MRLSLVLLRSECIQFYYNNMFNNNVRFDIGKHNIYTYYIVYLYTKQNCVNRCLIGNAQSPTLENKLIYRNYSIWK